MSGSHDTHELFSEASFFKKTCQRCGEWAPDLLALPCPEAMEKLAEEAIEEREGGCSEPMHDHGDGCPDPDCPEGAGGIVEKDMKKGRGDVKPPLVWVPLWALQGVARVFAYGNRKYAPGNWKRAANDNPAGAMDDYVSAALRHIAALQNGETRDPESGLPHLDHALCSLIMARGIGILGNQIGSDPGRGNDAPHAE